MSKPKVLITKDVPKDYLEPILETVELIVGGTETSLMPRTEVLGLLPKLDAIINQIELQVDQEILDNAHNLKIVANPAAGFDNLNTNLMAKHGVWATNAAEPFALATAECTFGLLLCLARRLPEFDRYVRRGDWKMAVPGNHNGMLLSGKTLGIIGYGRIGKVVAQQARAFNMRVIHHRLHKSHDSEYRSLPDLLAESDFVTLHTPLTHNTKKLINEERLTLMKKGAYLINTSRGPVVDESALVNSLENGHLGGAAIDVFEDEPQVHPGLIKLENVVLTPHLGGGARETRLKAHHICCENVLAVLGGESPPNALNDPENPRNQCQK
jgi:glyoxylate reductase